MKNKIVVFSLLIFSITAHLSAQTVERVEPPFWWCEMENKELQLMVYGEQIGTLRPEIQHQSVTIKKVHQPDNKNYLFIDILIPVGTESGEFEILFKEKKKVKLRHAYELKSRKKDSAGRKGFDNSDVVYLITPDRFANGNPNNDEVAGLKEGLNRSADFGRHGGDIQGITNHLDYIKDIGFTAIWLNPVLENDQGKWSYHGYATTDYYKVDSRFGSNEEYINLSKTASKMGIGMIMDVIVNHCGSQHWWMTDPPFEDWINRQEEPYLETNHRKETLLDPYASQADRDRMIKGWFVPAMPDLNQRNRFMSKYLIQNSIWWIEYADLAGLRQDTYSYPFREFMIDWTCAIMNEYPNFNIVGEEWVDNTAVISYWQNGKVNKDGYASCLPSLMDFPLVLNLAEALKVEETWSTGLIQLYQTLANDFHYADPSKLVIFPDNHDMSRIFTQLDEDFELYKMALTYILTMRGTPQLFYGTEILMSHPGTDSHGIIRSDFPGGWAGDAVNAFEGKNLSPQALAAQQWVKEMIAWRKSNDVFNGGKLMHFEPREGVYVYFRYNETASVMVILNKNKTETTLPLDRFEERLEGFKKGADVLLKKEVELGDKLILPPNSATLLELK